MVFVILFLGLEYFGSVYNLSNVFCMYIHACSDQEETHLDGPTASLILDARF